MRFRGDMITFYRLGRGVYVKVHYERDTGYFTVYIYRSESSWLHHYQCKDFLKAAKSVEDFISENSN